jgi:hypothetical protein
LLKKLNLNLKPEDHHNLKISDMTILKTWSQRDIKMSWNLQQTYDNDNKNVIFM